ncbi:MAG: hypothetical protein DWQ19_11965 [Crenarchaeota archaeon]|nr:MAG: hypothetical protein DWQ19_11965 [Thermoproteota archaeon]
MIFTTTKDQLQKINSLTKYPSISTYHVLGQKGRLTNDLSFEFEGTVYATEKVDGTNARIIFMPDGKVIVGSREDLLWEFNDLIENNTMNIVNTVKKHIHRQVFLDATKNDHPSIFVLYGEVYGKGIGPGKNYAKEERGFRLFDIIRHFDFKNILEMPREKISQWRDHGGQSFVHVDELKNWASVFNIEVVPPLFEGDAADLPKTHEEVNDWLLSMGDTRCALDNDALGTPEGVVVRTADRKIIAKLRREDYRRTLRAKSK